MRIRHNDLPGVRPDGGDAMTPAQGGARKPWAPPTYGAAKGGTASPMLRMAFLGFCFYIFAFNSRILDLGVARLHLPGIALGLAVVAAVLGGRIAEVLRSQISFFMAGLSIWLAISIPGAFWRGGSFEVLVGSWIPAMLLFLVGASVITTAAQCRRALFVFGLATITGATLVMLWGSESHGRLLLAGSRYANSNTIAIMLLLGMPAVWLLADGPQVSKVRKALAGGVLVLMVAEMLRTGSREGLVGMVALGAIVFARSRAVGKVAIACLALVLGLSAVVFLPESVKARLGTFFGTESMQLDQAEAPSEWTVANSAAESSQLRLRLLEDSLKVSATHPFLGVGLGNFAPYCAAMVKESGRRGHPAWVGTHNTYTQLSAEMGIPALIFYLGVLVASMRALQQIYRRARRIPGNEARDIAHMALALHTSFVTFCVVCCFSHMAYEPTMPLMAGIALAMSKTAPAELRRMEEATKIPNTAGDSKPPRAKPNRAGEHVPERSGRGFGA